MAKTERERYEPSAEQRALFPAVSGNTVNGLGEPARRRPTPIYWHRPERLAHGKLQRYMIDKFLKEPALAGSHKGFGGRGPERPEPVAPTRAEDTAANWSAGVKDFALAHDADLVGIARLDPDWVFEGYEVDAPFIVMLGVAMDQPRLARTAPELDSALEVQAQYNRGTRAARYLANWIRGRGWHAVPHGGPWAGPVTLIPPALACGFGEFGKHGSIINREYGSSFRLAGVTTDLPLLPDQIDTFGAEDFCTSCQVCKNACPPQAIVDDKQMVRGMAKWYVDFDKCIPYFNDTHGCGICIAVCPWSRPGTAPKLAERMTRRRERLAAE